MPIVQNAARSATGGSRAFLRAPNISTVLEPEDLFYAMASVADDHKLRKLWKKAWDKAGGDRDEAAEIMRLMVDIHVLMSIPTVANAPTKAQRVIRRHLRHISSVDAWDSLCRADPRQADSIASEIVTAVVMEQGGAA